MATGQQTWDTFMTALDNAPAGADPNDYKSILYGDSTGLSTGSSLTSGITQSLLTNIMQTFSGISSMNDGLNMISDGANLTAGIYRSSGNTAMQGANFKAKVYRQAGDAAITTANYNIALDQIQTDRAQDALGRQLSDVLSSNVSKVASSGISLNSKSVAMVQNDVMSSAERQFVQTKNDAIQRQTVIKYQGDLAKMNYENMARSSIYEGQAAQQQAENNARQAEYSGKLQSYELQNKMSDQIGQSISGIFSSFGGV